MDQAIKGEFVAEALNGYLGTERKNSFVFFYSARQLDVIHIHLCGFTPPPPHGTSRHVWFDGLLSLWFDCLLSL